MPTDLPLPPGPQPFSPIDGMPGPFSLVLVLVFLAILVPLAIFIARRVADAAYAKKAAAHGWTFETRPGTECAVGLNCPPFGLGRERETDDLVVGATTRGVPFRAFSYRSDLVPESFLAALSLGRPVPEAHLGRDGRPRPGVTGVGVQAGGWSVVAKDAAWASEVARALLPAADALRILAPDVTLSLDGDCLVVGPLPRDPDALAPLLEASAAVVAASSALRPAVAPALPVELGFYDHPGWAYRPRDDSWLDSVSCTTGGTAHEARDVTIAGDSTVRLVAFMHHWDTHETRTTVGADGKPTTQTHTVHHTEPVAEIVLGFPFGAMSLNWGALGGRLGHRLRFESDDFNRRYRVDADDDRFAYDVVHPQMMEWLLSIDAPEFSIAGGHMMLSVGDIELVTLDDRLGFALAFFGRVRRYTWENLGLPAPPVPPAP